ncbi:hypothetical protein M514_28213, partial [Trichuris suis]
SDGIEKVSKLENKGLHKTVSNGSVFYGINCFYEEEEYPPTFLRAVRTRLDLSLQNGWIDRRVHPDKTALATVLDKESQPRTDDTNPRRHTKPEEEEEQQQQQYKPYNSNNSSNRSNGRKKKKTNAQGG